MWCQRMYSSFAEAYRSLLLDLMHYGEEVPAIRGRETKELLNYGFCIKNPSLNLAYSKNRKFSIMHAINESLGLFNNDDSVKFASLFNNNMANFSDDGRKMYGCYGKRLYGYIYDVIRKLSSDSNSRSAVINIYNSKDGNARTKDIPCTETLQFLVRDGRLNMIVNMRSNDCIWGTPYDVFMFTNMQMVIANELGLKVGKYYHNAGSMHLYEDMYSTAFDMIKNGIDYYGHYNTNNYIEWCTLSSAVSKFASNKTVENIELIREATEKLDDRIYGDMVLKEIEFKYGMETGVLDEDVKDSVFAYPFSKRWNL